MKQQSCLVARYFQYCVEVFFKEIVIDSPLGKTKYYAIPVELCVDRVLSISVWKVFLKTNDCS